MLTNASVYNDSQFTSISKHILPLSHKCPERYPRCHLTSQNAPSATMGPVRASAVARMVGTASLIVFGCILTRCSALNAGSDPSNFGNQNLLEMMSSAVFPGDNTRRSNTGPGMERLQGLLPRSGSDGGGGGGGEMGKSGPVGIKLLSRKLFTVNGYREEHRVGEPRGGYSATLGSDVDLDNYSGSKRSSLENNHSELDSSVVPNAKLRHHSRDSMSGKNIAPVSPPEKQKKTQESNANIPTDQMHDSVTPSGGNEAKSPLPNVFILVHNDTESLRHLIQKTIEKMFDRLEAHILFHDMDIPDGDHIAPSSLDASDRQTRDPPFTNGEFEEMLLDERLSAWQHHIEQSYENVLGILLEATSLQTIPENLEFWEKVYGIMQNSNFLSRTKRSPRRGRRRRPGYRYRARFLKHMRRQLMINYGHVTPCAWKDRFYCMNGGTCVIIGDLDIKTCRCPIGFTNTRCQQIDQEYILSLLNNSLVFS